MIKLDNRLQMLYNMVRNHSKIVDVGSDHGYLISKLILDEKCPSGKCVDINLKCLDKSKKLAEKYNLTSKITFSHSDGLKNVLPQECDDIVIAGMGSELIIKIIDDCNWLKNINNKYLILQPMTKPWLLREYLFKNKFEIVDENLTFSKKFYYISIVAKFCNIKRNISDFEKVVGILPEKDNKYIKNYFYILSKRIKNISEKVLLYEKNYEKYENYEQICNKIDNIIN